MGQYMEAALPWSPLPSCVTVHLVQQLVDEDGVDTSCRHENFDIEQT